MKKYYPEILVFISYFIVVLWYYPINIFEFDPDESRNMLKGLLLSKGHVLYSEIWSDQPPLLTYILAAFYKILGFSIEYSRILILVFASSLITSFFSLIRRNYGVIPALSSAMFLALSHSFMRLSLSVMIGLVSLSFLLMALRAWNSSPILAGVMSAFSVAVKLISLPWILLCYVYFFIKDPVKAAGFSKSFIPVFTLVIFFIVLFLGFPAGENLIINHLKAYLYDSTSPQLAYYFLLKDPGLVLSAFLAVILPGFLSDNRMILGSYCLLLSLIFLLGVHPFQYHYYPIYALCLAWISSYSWNYFFCKSSPKSIYRLCGQSLVLAFLILNIYTGTKKLRYEKAVFSKRDLAAFEVVSDITKFAANANNPWIFTDRVMFALRAGMLVPPEIAVLSKKRLNAEWSKEEINLTLYDSIIKKYKPSQVILSRFPVSNEVRSKITEDFILYKYLRISYLFNTEHFVKASIANHITDE